MFARRTDHTADTVTERGPSLARGPAWLVGLALAAFGLAMFFRSGGTPLSTAGFPDGTAVGNTFLGIETNAWTAWGTTAAGVLVLIGAAQHVAAKAMSLITGLALGIAALIALIDGDVLGLAAANTWTIVGWAIASGVLLVTALLPRVTHEHELATADRERVVERDQVGPVPATDAPATAGVRSAPLRQTYQEPVATERPAATEQPVGSDPSIADADRRPADDRTRVR